MGVPLLLDVIRMVHPTHIIQFNHDAEMQANKNLPKITDDFLMDTPGWVFSLDEEQELSNNHRFAKCHCVVSSVRVDSVVGWHRLAVWVHKWVPANVLLEFIILLGSNASE